MRKRRTKAQISHDNYCAEVDKYKYFILDLETDQISTGFEYKGDARDAALDYIDAKVYTKRQLVKLGYDVNEKIQQWKNAN